ncbi:omptin family outer membrane protease [Treponema pedis]|uniref:omptin family outer membrane protease n=1 Tax=Treponema pedis TaxID=409322 RepID=UPI000428AC2B|nr:omptin family outer membrane protease [Treponema pedis]
MNTVLKKIRRLFIIFTLIPQLNIFSQSVINGIYTEDIQADPEILKKSPISFAIGIAPKLEIGSGFEYVFKNYNEVLSKLIWPLLPASGFQATTEIYIGNGFHTVFNAVFSIPHSTGKMRDYDFLNHTKKDVLTHFSMHKCILEQGKELGFTVGWIMPLAEYFQNGNKIKIYAEPCIGLRYYSHTWLAFDGYLQYSNANSELTPETPKVLWKGNAAQYRQDLVLPNIGILFKFDLPKKWQIKTAVQVCPQVLGLCEDNHFGRNIVFYDIFHKKGFSLHINFFAEKKLNNVLGVFFSTDCSAITSYNGISIARKSSNKNILSASQEGSSGTAFYTAVFSVGMMIRLGE